MPRIFFLSMLIIPFWSCRSESKSSSDTSSTTPDITSIESDKITPEAKMLQLAVPFSGNWLSEAYLNDIVKNKSPRKAQEGSEECFIHIPGTTLQPTTMVYNFHEGFTDIVTIREKEAYQLWEKLNDKLTRQLYLIEVISADKIKIGTVPFVRISPSVSKKGDLILEEILFKGKYEDINKKQIEFKNNGEVTGLGKYKYYLPVMDYFDAGLDVDQIGLGETRDKFEYFGFKFRNDNLILYKLKCVTFDKNENRCVEVDFGEKTYDLRKI